MCLMLGEEANDSQNFESDEQKLIYNSFSKYTLNTSSVLHCYLVVLQHE